MYFLRCVRKKYELSNQNELTEHLPYILLIVYTLTKDSNLLLLLLLTMSGNHALLEVSY